MAAKRITSSTVDWAAFFARVPKQQTTEFHQFKVKSDVYNRLVAAQPDSLPKINWDQYKGRINVAGMVEEFQKQYEAIKIPYPEDKYTSKITQKEKVAMKDAEIVCAESDVRIRECEKELKRWDSIVPFDQMTRDEFADLFPDLCVTVDKPSFFPHTPEAQPGYVPKEEEAKDH